MRALEIVYLGLEEGTGEAFGEAMRPELQRRLLEFTPEEWEKLTLEWPERPVAWIARLCETLSPGKHGQFALALLMAIAVEGPADCLDIAAEKLIASQALHESDRGLLRQAIESRDGSQLGHHGKQRHLEMLAQLGELANCPSIAEAAEHTMHNREALKAGLMAACYYCQTLFAAHLVSEYADGGETALCPYCGTDAVLASSAGFNLSAAGLQALNEYWFI